MDYSRIIYSTEKRIAVITLNCPDTKNAFDAQMSIELMQAFTQAQRDSNIRIIILKAEGDTFCSGYELKYFEKIEKYDFNQNLQDSINTMKLFQLIYTLRKPVVAVVQGPAISVGCGLISVCDYIISARETAKFGFSEVQYGSIPAIALLFIVRKIGEGRARDIVISGNMFDSEEAFRIGLVNKVVPMIDLNKYAVNFAEELISNNSGSSMGLIKELLSRIHGMTTSDALDYASHLNALSRMTEDSKHGIEAMRNDEKLKW